MRQYKNEILAFGLAGSFSLGKTKGAEMITAGIV